MGLWRFLFGGGVSPEYATNVDSILELDRKFRKAQRVEEDKLKNEKNRIFTKYNNREALTEEEKQFLIRNATPSMIMEWLLMQEKRSDIRCMIY